MGIFPAPPRFPGLPLQEEFSDSFFQQFFGQQTSFLFATPTVDTREDENFYYFDVPLKKNQESKVRANVSGDYLEIEGEISERSGSETANAQRTVQRSFSQIFPLPAFADAKSLQIISEPGRTVIRLEKKK
jgi:HSP20 family molecular chaperone IbpA